VRWRNPGVSPPNEGVSKVIQERNLSAASSIQQELYRLTGASGWVRIEPFGVLGPEVAVERQRSRPILMRI
jgi:hypothetical protein